MMKNYNVLQRLIFSILFAANFSVVHAQPLETLPKTKCEIGQQGVMDCSTACGIATNDFISASSGPPSRHSHGYGTCLLTVTNQPVIDPNPKYCGVTQTGTWSQCDYAQDNSPPESSFISMEYAFGQLQVCDTGYSLNERGTCSLDGFDNDQNNGEPLCGNGAGNPINVSTGNKYHKEFLFEIPGPNNSGAFILHYNSLSRGNLWTHSFSQSVSYINTGLVLEATVLRPDGKAISFSRQAYSGTNTTTVEKVGKYYYNARISSGGTIYSYNNRYKLERRPDTEEPTIWIFTDDTGNTEKYDSKGRVREIALLNGFKKTIAYGSDDKITSVTDSYGRAINFSNQNGITQVTSPAGTWSFGPNGITYPDGTQRQFLYENTSLPASLTGIVDENGHRFSLYTYDESGRAITSEHSGGVDKVTVLYNRDIDGTISISNAIGMTEQRRINSYYGIARCEDISRSDPNGTIWTSSTTYDSNGNVASYTDQNGNYTSFEFDADYALETKRIENYEKTIYSQYDTVTRKPLSINEPNKSTKFTYDTRGNLLSKKITSGSLTRTWSWTYGNYGQIATYTDPNGKVTSYSYDTNGNLKKITNPLGQATEFLQYDAAGKVLSYKLANGSTINQTFTNRGLLKTRIVGTETTAFSYDYAGQLVRVTLPDGSYLNYGYDSAHRLIDISDSIGNKIHYTLDLMGNKVQEEVIDPSGTLANTIKSLEDQRNNLFPNMDGAA